MRPTLHLLCGMAGAGKTTLAKVLEAQTDAVRLSPDEWLLELMADPADRAEMDRMRPTVEALQWRMAERLLDAGRDVILENGFWQRDERRGRREAGQRLGAVVVLHFLDVPRDVLLDRIQARNRTLEAGALFITERELDLWLGSWLERPDEAELVLYDRYEIHRP